MIRRRAALLLTIAMTSASQLEASAPRLDVVLPRGGQRGQKLELRLLGQRLSDARELLSYSQGLRLSAVTVKSAKEVRVRLEISAECRLGEHSLRLRTASGLSELRTFWVGSLPELAEKEPNNRVDQAQETPIGRTLTGRVTTEDIDRFRFRARRGDRVTAELEGFRLGGPLFDPCIAIVDSAGFVLASNDDSALLRQDSLVTLLIPRDDEYLIELRDASYAGHGRAYYRLHFGRFARPTALYPAGGSGGRSHRLELHGDAATVSSETFSVPAGPPAIIHLAVAGDGSPSPSPLPFRRSPLENLLEREPNDQRRELITGTPPCAFNGRLAKAGDRDWFRFEAKKGQTIVISVFARRLRSPLDAVLTIHDLKGRRLAANDDLKGPDSGLRFKAPADGGYALLIRDHLGRGSPDGVYRVELDAPRPGFALSLPKQGRRGQARQHINVPRGQRMAALVAVDRRDFGAELELSIAPLPSGVTVRLPRVPRGQNRIPVLFEAAAACRLGAALLPIHGRALKGPVRGILEQRAELVYGPPNNALYWQRSEDRLALAVTEPVPFSVRLTAPGRALIQNGTLALQLELERAPGFKGPVRLEQLFDPPGVSASRGVRFKPGQTRAQLAINANNRARVGSWPLVVLAHARVGDGDRSAATNMIRLEIRAPRSRASLKRASVELGGAAELLCDLTHGAPFEGQGRLKLVGLPRGVQAAPLTFGFSDTRLSFEVECSSGARPGRYRNLSVLVEEPSAAGLVSHRSGRGELRLDRPRPAPAGDKKAKAPAKKRPKKPTKGLSRLEQLRREHAARDQGHRPAATKEAP